jgi:regulator of replication initiation timing
MSEEEILRQERSRIKLHVMRLIAYQEMLEMEVEELREILNIRVGVDRKKGEKIL